MFIELTHTHSGERVFIRADKVHTVREKQGKTLVITDDKGQYVNESAGYVVALVEKVIGQSYTVNICTEGHL